MSYRTELSYSDSMTSDDLKEEKEGASRNRKSHYLTAARAVIEKRSRGVMTAGSNSTGMG